ncbi:MAG: hypothetical protein ACK56F_32365 [bacterium]
MRLVLAARHWHHHDEIWLILDLIVGKEIKIVRAGRLILSQVDLQFLLSYFPSIGE